MCYVSVDSSGGEGSDGSQTENPLHEERSTLVIMFLLCIGGAFSSLYALWGVQNGPYFWRRAVLFVFSLLSFACGVYQALTYFA